jgi:hypothetical protein
VNLGFSKLNIYDFTCNVCMITKSKRPSNMLTINRDIIEPVIKRPRLGNWGGSKKMKKTKRSKRCKKTRRHKK